MLVIYGLLQLAYNIINWTMSPETQAKTQLVKWLSFRVWLIVTPILTIILIGLIVRKALRVINDRNAKHESEINGLREEMTAQLNKKEAEISELQTRLEREKAALQSQLEAEQAKSVAPEIAGGIQEILINQTFRLSESFPQVNAILRRGPDDSSSSRQSSTPQVGSHVTLKAHIINQSSVPRAIAS